MTNKDECREAFEWPEHYKVNEPFSIELLDKFCGGMDKISPDKSYQLTGVHFWQFLQSYKLLWDKHTRATIMVDSPTSNDGALIVERAAPQSTTTSRDDWQRVMELISPKLFQDGKIPMYDADKIEQALAICERNLKE